MNTGSTDIGWRRMSPTDWSPAQHRATRHKREAVRRRANALLLLAADARIAYRGIDHTVSALAENIGFERFDLTIIRVAFDRRTITLIIAPRRIWHTAETRNELLSLKRQANNLSVRCMLVPETTLKKQPRRANSQLIGEAGATVLTVSQRIRVETFVVSAAGSATLSMCAELLPEHPDPISAVLALVRVGILLVPLDKAICPDTPVLAVSELPSTWD